MTTVPNYATIAEKKVPKDPDIVPFSTESKMQWSPWLNYF